MSHSVTLRLSDVELRLIETFAENSGLTLSAAIRLLVKRGLEQNVGDQLIKELARDPNLRASLHRLIVLGIS